MTTTPSRYSMATSGSRRPAPTEKIAVSAATATALPKTASTHPKTARLVSGAVGGKLTRLESRGTLTQLQPVSTAGRRQQVSWARGIRLDLLAQMPHLRAQVRRIGRRAVAPDGDEDLLLRHRLGAALGQREEELALERRE